ncbi:hypothetical protein HNV08_07630 [Winogradskyella eckloniae]|uniref:hypothetical protein n=1 Tax=Winogradskyella eckloniae TaxID=1089306 RepID=UPI0015667E0C|nr:hypothetical protein [Winogradskyella eckloniae]NRD19914.1 hypothetical protein [Winogradskyella eckloniae]
MKKVIIAIGIITAIIATILAASKFYNLSVAPTIIAFLCGISILFLSKKDKTKTKSIQYIFLLAIISLSLTIYKGVTHPIQSEDTNQTDGNNVEDTNSKATIGENTKEAIN